MVSQCEIGSATLVGAFSVIVQPVVKPMDRFAALVRRKDNVVILATISKSRRWTSDVKFSDPILIPSPQARDQSRIILSESIILVKGSELSILFPGDVQCSEMKYFRLFSLSMLHVFEFQELKYFMQLLHSERKVLLL